MFVFLLVALKDLLDRPEHPLEGISLNRQQIAFGCAFYTSLSRGVPDQGNLSEVVTSSELENFLVCFFGDQIAIGNDVKFVSFFSFFHNVAASFIGFLFHNVTKLLLLEWIDFGKNGDL